MKNEKNLFSFGHFLAFETLQLLQLSSFSPFFIKLGLASKRIASIRGDRRVGSKNRKTGKFQKTENRISGTRFFWILVIFLEIPEKFGKFRKNRKPIFWASIFLEITDRDIGSVRTGYWS